MQGTSIPLGGPRLWVCVHGEVQPYAGLSTASLLCPQPLLGQTGLPQGPSEQKVAVVSVDGCDTGVALRFGAMLGNYSCAAQGTQGGSKK